jgi:hypothetical protein
VWLAGTCRSGTVCLEGRIPRGPTIMGLEGLEPSTIRL